MENKAKLIAFYLPQFHPIPENDKWWGKGFTEWTNVGKAKPLFSGHYQPRVPKDLGYYDLRVPETRKQQADLAKEFGIGGFCYWHYWFGNGKRLIERPFNEVVASGEPDFPFCLAWANESWKGFAHGLKNRNMLIEQLYPGVEDFENHFNELLPAFKDKRYIKVDGKPLFMIYKPLANEEIKTFIKVWRKLAKENGLEDFYFIGHNNDAKIPVEDVFEVGVDGVNTVRLDNYQLKERGQFERLFQHARKQLLNTPQRYSYKKVSEFFTVPEVDCIDNVYPSIVTGWDHSPRSHKEGLILTDFTPENFSIHVQNVLDIVENKPEEHKIVFIKSWNEWAEGNYLEPDMKWGVKFLEILKEKIKL
ncbi:glycoside hydrolase family 99-like domain-containing protein [Chryseobacterium rhizosphaerae]|uniref:glycosyltransferase WbsX family protein n=1 Tax=Chryseobacterium rhizosphaerae TaxID=395937 RepID=UPI002359BD15|nr:glycoside hydrolase family 99-like domain-containing protein [Chryseobacterium rhizosphaerae]MDC8098918.1 glycoside hydrolase family 99-like domain-containing protein [Chryseobacterium rhizosphaerae]